MMRKKTQKKACRFRNGYCKKVSGDNHLQFCENHYNLRLNFLRNNPSIIKERHHHRLQSETPDLNKNQKKEMKKQNPESFIPPDEERCCKTDGVRWRCKNFRMRQSCGAEDCKYCDKHCKSYAKQNQKQQLKKRSRDDDDDEFDDSNSDIETRDSKCLKHRRKKQQLTEEDELATGGIQPPTNHTSSDGFVGGGSTDIGTKRKEVEATSGELESLTGIGPPVVESESMEHYKTKCFELSVELEKKEIEFEKKEIELEKKEIELEKKEIEIEKKEIELEKKEIEFEKKEIELEKMKIEIEKNNVELEKKKMELEKNKVELEEMKIEFEKKNVELEKKNVELEKKNVECTELQGKYEVESRKNAAKNDEDATQYWRNKCSDLETVVQKMEIENSMTRCEASHVSNLKSLVLRIGNESDSSILRCEELRNSDRMEFEVLGLQNEIIQSGEKQRDKNNMNKPNAESRKDSHVYDVSVTKHHESVSEIRKYSPMNISSGSLSGGENVEEGNGWGCSEERPCQHGSSSQDHLDLIKEPFANLVSDDGGETLGNSESYAGSKNSLGDLMDLLVMKYRNRNDGKEMKWKSEPELLSSFEEDPELCMKAVCALYRQEISEDEMSPKGLYFDSDRLRCTTLAKFLMGEDCKGDINKSVKELETLDSKALVDCKKLARRYSIHLFHIYQNGKDPFFRPAATSCPGDQTAAS